MPGAVQYEKGWKEGEERITEINTCGNEADDAPALEEVDMEEYARE